MLQVHHAGVHTTANATDNQTDDDNDRNNNQNTNNNNTCDNNLNNLAHADIPRQYQQQHQENQYVVNGYDTIIEDFAYDGSTGGVNSVSTTNANIDDNNLINNHKVDINNTSNNKNTNTIISSTSGMLSYDNKKNSPQTAPSPPTGTQLAANNSPANNMVAMAVPSTPPNNALGHLKYEQELLYITENYTVIGRNSSTSLVHFHVAENNLVSRKHFQLIFNNDTQDFFVQCLSKNGIFVDDYLQRRNAEPLKLPQSCYFRFPSTEIRIQFENFYAGTGPDSFVGVTSGNPRSFSINRRHNHSNNNNSKTNNNLNQHQQHQATQINHRTIVGNHYNSNNNTTNNDTNHLYPNKDNKISGHTNNANNSNNIDSNINSKVVNGIDVQDGGSGCDATITGNHMLIKQENNNVDEQQQYEIDINSRLNEHHYQHHCHQSCNNRIKTKINIIHNDNINNTTKLIRIQKHKQQTPPPPPLSILQTERQLKHQQRHKNIQQSKQTTLHQQQIRSSGMVVGGHVTSCIARAYYPPLKISISKREQKSPYLSPTGK